MTTASSVSDLCVSVCIPLINDIIGEAHCFKQIAPVFAFYIRVHFENLCYKPILYSVQTENI